MTAALQITDTDIAFVFKAKCREMKQEVFNKLRLKAELQKTHCRYKCGAYELMSIIAGAHKKSERVG
jgi:hypothetical protein